jgi:hypothetical protein
MAEAMRVPEAVFQALPSLRRAGGRARARRLAPAARQEIARHAALRRWIRARFGAGSFAELGLPGGAVVDQGLADLASGRESDDSLLVSLAAPRLRREGVPLPAGLLADPETRLYRSLSRAAGSLAHARYLAHLEQMTSFADACRGARRRAQ